MVYQPSASAVESLTQANEIFHRIFEHNLTAKKQSRAAQKPQKRAPYQSWHPD
jgi:hypothetical protein